jgi:hypothetical protein
MGSVIDICLLRLFLFVNFRELSCVLASPGGLYQEDFVIPGI